MTNSELLETILERPSMYVGKPSVPLIAAFNNGYHFAREKAGIGETDEFYVGFHGFVAKRFGITTSHGWATIVVFMGQSETGAYELTKDLWQQYKTERKQST